MHCFVPLMNQCLLHKLCRVEIQGLVEVITNFGRFRFKKPGMVSGNESAL